MVKAIWNNTVVAQSDKTIIIEGNHYFPPDSVNAEFLKDSTAHTICPWKGTASYHSLEVGGQTNKDAVWYYPQPKDAAKQIAGYFAFWKGVQVVSE